MLDRTSTQVPATPARESEVSVVKDATPSLSIRVRPYRPHAAELSQPFAVSSLVRLTTLMVLLCATLIPASGIAARCPSLGLEGAEHLVPPPGPSSMERPRSRSISAAHGRGPPLGQRGEVVLEGREVAGEQVVERAAVRAVARTLAQRGWRRHALQPRRARVGGSTSLGPVIGLAEQN